MTLVLKRITPETGTHKCPVCQQTPLGYVGAAQLLAICLEGTELEVCGRCASGEAPELEAVLKETRQLESARDLMTRKGTVSAFKILGALLRPVPKNKTLRRAPPALEAKTQKALPSGPSSVSANARHR